MRVLYLVERFWPYIGGVEVISARLLAALHERGHEVVVVTSRDDSRLPENDDFTGVQVHRLPLVDAVVGRDLDLVADTRLRVSAITRELRPDVVHSVFTGPSIFFVPSRSVSGGAALVLGFHGSWPQVTLAPNGKLVRLLDGADWVTACSASALNDLRRMWPGVGPRSSVLLNGLAGPEREPGPPPAGPPVVLCLGRLVRDKGFDVALEAFVAVVTGVPGARLVFAGDGPERGVLEAQAAALGLGDHLDVLGWVSPDTVHELIRGASVVLLPSRLEGFGLVALEAALMARPVVASDVGGLPEVVEDGVTGTLVPVGDAGALTAAILALLRNPEEAATMGRHARNRALREFTATRYADDHEALYDRLVGAGAGRGR